MGGEDLKRHWTNMVSSLRDALAEVERLIGSSTSPEFSRNDLEQGRAARAEQERQAKQAREASKAAWEERQRQLEQLEHKRPATVAALLKAIDSQDGAQRIRREV